jgi:hypothetical protein
VKQKVKPINIAMSRNTNANEAVLGWNSLIALWITINGIYELKCAVEQKNAENGGDSKKLRGNQKL